MNGGWKGVEEGREKWIEDPLQLRSRMQAIRMVQVRLLPGREGRTGKGYVYSSYSPREESRFIDLSRARKCPRTAFRYCLPRESTLSRRIRGRERERVCTGTVPSIFALRGILRREGRWRRLLGKFLEITALELESHPILRSPPKLVPKKDRIVPGSFPRFRVHRGWTRA